MMDDATITFITEQNRQLKDDLKDIIMANGTVIRGKIESEVDRIDEMDKKRNGRICKNEDDIKDLKKDTRASRWLHRNPKAAVIIILAASVFLMTAFHTINVKRTIEKITKIELNE